MVNSGHMKKPWTIEHACRLYRYADALAAFLKGGHVYTHVHGVEERQSMKPHHRVKLLKERRRIMDRIYDWQDATGNKITRGTRYSDKMMRAASRRVHVQLFEVKRSKRGARA